MSQKTNDAISRSDRVLVAAMAIILATASAAIGASLTYHPSTDKVVAIKPAVQAVEVATLRLQPAPRSPRRLLRWIRILSLF